MHSGALTAQLPRVCQNLGLPSGFVAAEFGLRNLNGRTNRLMIVTALAVSLCACSVAKGPRDETRQLSPRVIKVGDPVPKGGGVFKIGDPYYANGKWYVPVNDPGYDRVGRASWYGDFFHGRLTANGEVYDMNALTGAHPTLPLPTYVQVTNLSNNRSIVVRINDRGPYHDNRIIDLSHKAAELLGFYGHGTATVRVRYLGPAPINGDDRFERSVASRQPWATRVTSGAAVPAPAPKTPQTQLLEAAVVSSQTQWPVVVTKGGFEARRPAVASNWQTVSVPAVTTPAIYKGSR